MWIKHLFSWDFGKLIVFLEGLHKILWMLIESFNSSSTLIILILIYLPAKLSQIKKEWVFNFVSLSENRLFYVWLNKLTAIKSQASLKNFLIFCILISDSLTFFWAYLFSLRRFCFLE